MVRKVFRAGDRLPFGLVQGNGCGSKNDSWFKHEGPYNGSSVIHVGLPFSAGGFPLFSFFLNAWLFVELPLLEFFLQAVHLHFFP